MRRLTLDPSGLAPALLTPPVSKSDAQRALVLAHLLDLWPLPSLAEEPEAHLPADVQVMLRGLTTLRSPPGGGVADIDCADGGAPFRILLTQAALTPGAHVRLHGTRRLGERPHHALLESLREALGPAGLTLREGTPWPLEVRAARGGGPTPTFRVSASQSSQYASSLLLGCAALALREGRPWAVQLEGELTSAGYLELTVQWLERFGFAVGREGGRLEVRLRERPTRAPALPGDWSSLGYLFLVAWKGGGRVARADVTSAHPDQALLHIVGEAGLTPTTAPDGTMGLEGRPHRGLEASGSECPDLLPTLAALACVLPGPTVLREVAVLRLKESDRLAGIQELVAAAGGQSRLEGDTLTLTPPARPAAHLVLESHDDHRMAMSAATLAILTGARLSLGEPDCVAKSFPGFWHQLERAGVRLDSGP